MKALKKLFLVLGLCLGMAFLVTILTVRIPAGPPMPSPAGNGDVNGDGDIDISDAVFLLLFLFRDGDAPVALAGPSPVVDDKISSIDATLAMVSQEFSRANENLEALVDAVTEIVTEEARSACEGRNDRFVNNGDGTVTDLCTGLLWMKATADIDGDGVVSAGGDKVPWEAARDHAERLILAGHADWRLPTARELSDLIVRDDVPSTTSMDPVFEVFSSEHWTGTTYFDDFAWQVAFNAGGGQRQTTDRRNNGFVLAVRTP